MNCNGDGRSLRSGVVDATAFVVYLRCRREEVDVQRQKENK